MNKKQQFIIKDDDNNITLIRWFKRHTKNIPLSLIAKKCRKKQITVDSRKCQANTIIKAKSIITIFPAIEYTEHSKQILNKNTTNDKAKELLQKITLFEDEDIIIINKPYGLAVQGGSKITHSLDSILMSMHKRPLLVHRLDKETSGLLILAKSKSVSAYLSDLFKKSLVKKIYWALIFGIPKKSTGSIDVSLAKGIGMIKRNTQHLKNFERMQVVKKQGNYQQSVTHYKTIANNKDITWIQLQPITGRTHQLRAHMENLGHPIIGDSKYNNFNTQQASTQANKIVKSLEIANKLHLAAKQIIFTHPNGKTININAPIPAHMKNSWKILGFDNKLDQ